jgi:hypothetical protein
MEAVRMVLITLGLALTAILVLGLVARAAAWARRDQVAGPTHATTKDTDRRGLPT